MTLGRQFVQVYRGLNNVSPDQVNTGKLGMHWTTDKSVAEDFALYDTEGYEGSGTILTAAVHKRHVASGLERKKMGASHDVFDSSHREQEVPVRSGGVVHLLGAETYDGSSASPAALPGLSPRRTGRA